VEQIGVQQKNRIKDEAAHSKKTASQTSVLLVPFMKLCYFYDSFYRVLVSGQIVGQHRVFTLGDAHFCFEKGSYKEAVNDDREYINYDRHQKEIGVPGLAGRVGTLGAHTHVVQFDKKLGKKVERCHANYHRNQQGDSHLRATLATDARNRYQNNHYHYEGHNQNPDRKVDGAIDALEAIGCA